MEDQYPAMGDFDLNDVVVKISPTLLLKSDNSSAKSKNIWTEHYSAVKAEVEDPDDPKTRINAELIRAVKART